MPQTVVLTVSSNGNAEFALHLLRQGRGPQVGAEGGDGLRLVLRHLAHQREKGVRVDDREVVVDADAQVALGDDLDAELR